MVGNLFNHEYPYTDFHELNLDWVIKKVKEFNDKHADGLGSSLYLFLLLGLFLLCFLTEKIKNNSSNYQNNENDQ